MLSDLAIGSFGDLWLHSGRETTFRLRKRDFRADLVARYPCPECGAAAGVLCCRKTVGGVLPRRLPHLGRGPASGKQGGLPRPGEK
jgi:hypothetical protein